MSNKTGFSLRENVRLRILKDMLSGVKHANSDVANFIMVVDLTTTKIVSSCAKMIELLEEGVVALERIDLKRKAFPKMHAIYFITPSEASVEALLKDFSSSKEAQYGLVHLFFTNRLDEPLIAKLAKHKTLSERIATFKEINLDFLSPEANVFHFDMPEALQTIYSRPDLRLTKKLEEKIAYKLSTVVPTLFDFDKFHIVYNKGATNAVSERVAKILHERIQKFVDAKKKAEEDFHDEPAGPIKIVILDRTFDPLTPVLHDYYYQSLLYELSDVKNDVVEYTTDDKTKKVVVLGDEDDLWAKYRHQFIGEAMSNIAKEFEEFVNSNKDSGLGKADMTQLDLETMSRIIKQMPVYQEVMGKYTTHMTLIEQCVKSFTEMDLKDIGDLEQSLATGVDSQGRSISNQKLIAMIAQKLAATGKVDKDMKLRLMMIASIALELPERDSKALIQSLPEEDKETLTKLFWLGVDPSKFAAGKGKTNKKLEEASLAAQNKLKNISANLCRYTPELENVANSLVTDKLNSDNYGSLYIPKNYDGNLGLKKGGSKKAAGKLDNIDERAQPKIIFFIIGGMSYSETRVVAEYAKNNPQFGVIAGSTSIMKANDYMTGISKMVSKAEYDELKLKD